MKIVTHLTSVKYPFYVIDLNEVYYSFVKILCWRCIWIHFTLISGCTYCNFNHASNNRICAKLFIHFWCLLCFSINVFVHSNKPESSKQFLKSSFVRLSMTCSKAVTTSLSSLNRIPPSCFSSFGGKKSQGLQSGEYAAFSYFST